MIAGQNDLIQKNAKQFATITEVRGRIDIMSADLKKKLNDRPTMEIFRSSIS